MDKRRGKRATAASGRPATPEAAPRRSVWFSETQLTDYALVLARSHQLAAGDLVDRLGPRLNRLERDVHRVFLRAREAAAAKQRMEPAAEWLIDNFFLVKEQLRVIRDSLPKGYSRQLPQLASASDPGVPRILQLARELVTHVDSRVDERLARLFVKSYQQGVELQLGELWALPLMLRIALIECIGEIAQTIGQRIDDYASAQTWAGRMIEKADEQPGDVVLLVADMARSDPPQSRAFDAEFCRLLQGRNPALNLPLAWIEQRLVRGRRSMATLLEDESRAQASDQVSVGNCISSLRLISRLDWAKTVESMSHVDDTLRRDPAAVYAHMDFNTRDACRHAVEDLARRSDLGEGEVAARVVEYARLADSADTDQRQKHVGYWLMGDGKRAFAASLRAAPRAGQRWRDALARHPSSTYLGAIAVLTALFAAEGVREATLVQPWPLEIMLLIALLVACSHAAVSLVNWALSHMLPPQLLPRMDFSDGMPASSATAVVVPCLLGDSDGIDEQLAALEVRFLGNQDAHLAFVLLTDFLDAPEQSMPGDAALLAHASEGIQTLNVRYGKGGGGPFLLLHRAREWSARQATWMGTERKRGKLGDLNRLLLGGRCDAFSTVIGDVDQLQGVRYVITLDADTELPPQTALHLVETMAHPLNRPRFDRNLHRVVQGYGILQPRISEAVVDANSSWFARLWSGDGSLDPYTRAVSDVYQDLFDEGSYVGKGIYDVRAFMRAVGRRFPRDLILSHDLLEGSYARTGLVSDITLREHQPLSYGTEVRRRHRWIRGDWQIGQWLTRSVPGPRRSVLLNTLSAYHRWKILDNLRRSLVPLSFMAVWLRGWLLSPRPLFWTVLLLGLIFIQPVLACLHGLVFKPASTRWPVHLRLWRLATGKRLGQTLMQLVMLPFEAMINVDAIVRTGFRMLFTRKRLLEWMPASALARFSRGGLAQFVRLMWIAPVGAITTAVLITRMQPEALVPASPLLLLGFLSPWVAWLCSQPRASTSTAILAPAERDFLGMVARRTWRYFDTFVDAEHNHLPPDNHQVWPSPHTASRTSPTNMGLALLANVTALDFGYVSPARMLQRCADTLASMHKLQRHRGHFLNWYDTRSLEPLLPQYVSTVDSGNLIGCLLVLRNALAVIEHAVILPPCVGTGLVDTLRVLDAEMAAAEQDADAAQTGIADLRAVLQQRVQEAAQPVTSLRDWRACIVRVQDAAAALQEQLLDREAYVECAHWTAALRNQGADWLQFLDDNAPWLALPRDLDLGEAGNALLARLDGNPSLFLARTLAGRMLGLLEQAAVSASTAQLDTLHVAMRRLCQISQARRARAAQLADDCGQLAEADFQFLSDPAQQLLSIGHDVERGSNDASYYDLLASEARLSSFIAIARRQLPQAHWFALGRALSAGAGQATLVSWSGSMFEYLMPLLVMPSYADTLLERACRAAIRNQISYGEKSRTPWGISESAYNHTDSHLTYQYRAFGVPGMGLKRGLADDLVIAPYASMLAAMLEPGESARNLQRLAELGALSTYGYFEALDYTPTRVPEGETFAMVRTYMVHHQGMGLLALSAVLHDHPMQRRFLREPAFRANRLLLCEKVPSATPIGRDELDVSRPDESLHETTPSSRVIGAFNTSVPQMQLLSNGRYHLAISQAGGGYSRWNDLALTHWGEDGTRDANGLFCYLRDLDSGHLWSNTLQPTRVHADTYSVVFAPARAEFLRTDDGIQTRTRIAVSPEDDIELRRVHITNLSKRTRRIEVTSFAEVVLARPSDAAAHPVFNKLFIETRIVRARQALLAQRRPRADDEFTPCMLHMLTMRGGRWGEVSFATDRASFIGRGQSPAQPRVMQPGVGLDGSEGATLDPMMAIRRVVELEPGASATVDMIMGITDTQDSALEMLERYFERRLDNRVFALAWTHTQVIRQQLDMGRADALLYDRLAGSIVHADPALRKVQRPLQTLAHGQSGLWKYGISGDQPIIVVRIASTDNFNLLRQLVKAHTWWRLRGLTCDLVVWNENASGYRQELHDMIVGLISSSIEGAVLDRSGGIFVRSIEHVTPEDRALMLATAHAVFVDDRGSLAQQMPSDKGLAAVSRRLRVGSQTAPARGSDLPMPTDLQYFNGHGGFSSDGREYVVCLPAGAHTPAPWSNVIANPQFGTVISESGGAYTWSQNAHDLRLTPWYNDPLGDDSGEAFYLRDEASGRFWSPAPGPARGAGSYVTRHGFGYSRFQSREENIATEMTVFVSVDKPVKLALIEVTNHSNQPRSLSVTAYVGWVLGEQRARSAMHVSTEIDAVRHLALANNFFNDNLSQAVAFLAASEALKGATCDRREFLGCNGNLAAPAALRRERLSGVAGAGMDPCAALQVAVELAPGESRVLVFALGIGGNRMEAEKLASQSSAVDAARAELARVHAQWAATTARVTVHTPDHRADTLFNGWLPYQVISARLWARSGYYQSSGAFGFRDQLQDVMALLHIDPARVREQLLLCAAHQFVEGDVQHWWHPPSSRGVRTHISDDYLWLPWVASQYVDTVGDVVVWAVQRPFLRGRALNPGEESYYDFADATAEAASLYEHCKRAIEHAIEQGLRFGAHGLPLIGSGDWNDGMNRVGHEGRGESIWLGFFLCDVLGRFAPHARARGDEAFAKRMDEERIALGQRLDAGGWDGAWYRRAYMDDGTPLGSAENAECRIDSIPQSWSVLSAAADPERARQAIDAAMRQLVREDAALVQLFDPPFDKTPLDPGYIKGYVPGVRENGGQYTHAAIWLVIALAKLGRAEDAWHVFDLINPIRHGDNAERVSVYKVEPYVVAADVYWQRQHRGRGGWTWYTGSAGWMHRLLGEYLLGLRRQGNRLSLTPCVPESWTGYRIDYRHGSSLYAITLTRNGRGTHVNALSVDGEPMMPLAVELRDDGREHTVQVRFGALAEPSSTPIALSVEPEDA